MLVRSLGEEVAAVLGDPQRHGGIISDFHPANGGRGFGLAWREVLAFGRASPTGLDVAAWIAWRRGIPRSRTAPRSSSARGPSSSPPRRAGSSAARGELACDDPRFQARVHWRVHRQSERGPVGDALWLDDTTRISHKILLVRAVSATEVVLESTGRPRLAHRWQRAAADRAPGEPAR